MTTEPRDRDSLSRRLRAALVRGLIKVWRRTLRRPVARLYHYDLIVSTDNFDSLSWAGRPIWQNPLDLWTIQEAISEVQPGLLIETGTHRGGSAQFYADLMDVLGSGRVLTIDVVDVHDLDHERVRFLHGSSTAPEIVEQVRGRPRGRRAR